MIRGGAIRRNRQEDGQGKTALEHAIIIDDSDDEFETVTSRPSESNTSGQHVIMLDDSETDSDIEVDELRSSAPIFKGEIIEIKDVSVQVFQIWRNAETFARIARIRNETRLEEERE